MDVKLIRKTRICRELVLSTPSGDYTVLYDGTGMGYESVLVDGVVRAQKGSRFRMVPRFEFPIGPHKGVISIETVLWRDLLAIFVGRLESFVLEVDGKVVYEDGAQLKVLRPEN